MNTEPTQIIWGSKDTDVLSISHACFARGLHAMTVNELLGMHRMFNQHRHIKPYYSRVLQDIVRELASRSQYQWMVQFTNFVATVDAHYDASAHACLLEQQGFKISYQDGFWFLINPMNQVIAQSTERTIKFAGIGEL